MTSQNLMPIVRPDQMDRIVVWEGARPVTQAVLLFQARMLAEKLPARGHVLNACGNRHAFLVAFLAALMRGQITVLPNDRSERICGALSERFSGLYCLSEQAAPCKGMETRSVSLEELPGTPLLGEVPAVAGEQIAAIAFTSGTTGEPLPSEKPLGVLRATARLIAQRFDLTPETPTAIVATVPPQHMYGLETSITLPLWSEASVHGARPLYPLSVAEALAAAPPPRILVTTPVHLRALLSARVRLPDLRLVISATAPLSVDLARQVERQFGTEVFEIFGFTEAGTVATRRTVESDRWLTLDGLTLRNAGKACLVDAEHWDEPVPMNDIVELLSPREFKLRGRVSDNVSIAGKRASLSGLNAVLNDIEGVLDGAFYFADEDDRGKVTRVVAFIVAPARTGDDIREELRNAIDPTFIPRRIYRVPSLPRSATGKLPRSALRELLERVRNGSG